MKCAITGGAGFIGSNIAETLLREGHEVRVIDNFLTGNRENIAPFFPHLQLFEGDIRDLAFLKKAFDGVEVVFHEAALPSVPRSVEDPILTHDININGTINVLEAALRSGVRRVVYAGSSSAYGDTIELPKHEAMVTNPLSPYAVQKLTGEYYCKVFASLYDIETVVLRYFNVFGKRQDPNSQYAAAIPRFVLSIANDEAPTIYGDGTQTRDFTYIDNVVLGNLLAATTPGISGMLFNCACGEQIVLNDVITWINEYFGKNVAPLYVPERAGDIKHSHASIALIQEKLGFTPKYLFKEGLYKTIDSYIKK